MLHSWNIQAICNSDGVEPSAIIINGKDKGAYALNSPPSPDLSSKPQEMVLIDLRSSKRSLRGDMVQDAWVSTLIMMELVSKRTPVVSQV